MTDGRFCTQVLLMEVEVKPGHGPRTALGCTELHEDKESFGEETGAAGGPKGVCIP